MILLILLIYLFVGVIISSYLSLGLVNNTCYDILLNVVSFISIILLWPLFILIMLFYT